MCIVPASGYNVSYSCCKQNKAYHHHPPPPPPLPHLVFDWVNQETFIASKINHVRNPENRVYIFFLKRHLNVGGKVVERVTMYIHLMIFV